MYDAETGLYYNYHRSYNPSIGAYTQSDPIGLAGGINTYAYVGGNPVGAFDPNGLAYFAYRCLGGWSFMCTWDWLGTRKFAHEHLFFEDGGTPRNVGFFGTGELGDEKNPSGYVRADGGYDDCIMRIAYQLVPALPKYDLFCANCQNWAQKVREKYHEIKNDPAVKEKCSSCTKETSPI